MTGAVLALVIALGWTVEPASPPLADSVANVEASVPDSQELAKLELVQRAWDGDSLERTRPATASASVGSLMAQIVASLAVLLGILGFGLILLRRMRQKSASAAGRGPGSMLDILETRALGQGNHLTLARIHDRVLALGHGQGGVSQIAEFTGNDAATILADHGDGAVSVRDFTATLDTFLDRFRTPLASPARDPEESR